MSVKISKICYLAGGKVQKGNKGNVYLTLLPLRLFSFLNVAILNQKEKDFLSF